jgi:hypothetical protein
LTLELSVSSPDPAFFSFSKEHPVKERIKSDKNKR